MELNTQFKRVNNFLEKVPEDFLNLVDIYVNHVDEQITVRFIIKDHEYRDPDMTVRHLEKLEQLPMVVEFEVNDDEVTFFLIWG